MSDIEVVDTGLQVEQSYNPSRIAEQRAAAKDYERKRLRPGEMVPLPNSEFARVQQAMPGAWYPGERTDGMLGDPATILLKPKPNWHDRMPRYAWFVREDAVKTGSVPRHTQTSAYERSGRIRYIEEKEVNVNHPYAVYEVYEVGGGLGDDNKPKPKKRFVTTGSLILAEIMDPKVSYNKYKAWDDLAISRMHQMPTELEQTNNIQGVPQVPGKLGIEVEEFAANQKTLAAGG